MKRRRWDSKTKTKIILDGLSERPVSEICNDYGIHQNQYYSGRDKFLAEAHRAFESKKDGEELNRIRKKNQELKQIIGSLTIESRKSEVLTTIVQETLKPYLSKTCYHLKGNGGAKGCREGFDKAPSEVQVILQNQCHVILRLDRRIRGWKTPAIGWGHAWHNRINF
jgi:transposase-like protein